MGTLIDADTTFKRAAHDADWHRRKLRRQAVEVDAINEGHLMAGISLETLKLLAEVGSVRETVIVQIHGQYTIRVS